MKIKKSATAKHEATKVSDTRPDLHRLLYIWVVADALGCDL